MEDKPSHFKDSGENCPIEMVPWEIVQYFIKKLNQIENTKGYRLPSEAEWEYACRTGSDAEFSFGDDVERLDEFAWYSKNSGGRTHPVAEKESNAWGLYDMHGNVWEWVEDDWHGSYNGAPDDERAWIDSPRGSNRVIRGGSWGFDARACRSATRSSYWPGYRSIRVGFRLSRSVALGP
jgi:formylglycine-generating enzyme required for sulfatase activity